jgi:tetratricopeptide (TPR) repeat protein
MTAHRPFSRARRHAAVCAVLLTALTFAAPVPALADLTRDEALQALESADATQRRDALLALADSGTQQDAERMLDALHDPDAAVRSVAEQAVWRVWIRSDDPGVNALMKSGMRYMDEGRLALAVDAFTQVIERQPDFAEGWNKRATVYFLIGDFDQSLRDCDETLKRNPNHFGALSGCGAIYARRDELDRAEDFLERALEINPNMPGVEQALALVKQRLGKRGRRSI